MILPRNRAYIDWTVPCDQDGHKIGVCTTTESYEEYLDWLADYLYVTDIPVPPNQIGLLKEYQGKGIAYAVLDLSDCLGYSIWETEGMQEASAGGKPFSEHHKAEIDLWNELPGDAKIDTTEQDFFTAEDDYRRLGVEYTESQKVPQHISHADIPYRPILAALLKQVHEHSERKKHLDFFYYNFNECASQ